MQPNGLPSRTSILTAAARALGSREPDPSVRNPDWLADRLIGPAELKLIVNASYQAIPTTSGSRYALDAYSMLDVSLPRDDSVPSVRQVAAQFQSESAGYLADFLRSVKDRLESAA